jgi:RNA-directed DNA polymerase
MPKPELSAAPSPHAPTFERVASFSALVGAAQRAALGHRRSPEVAGFLLELEPQVLQLERELRDGSYAPRPYRTFMVHEPKPRTISAAAFRDRVVHHALCTELEPTLERVALPWSFACRRGKGVLAALRHVQRLTRRHRYILKLDVQHFFETASHGVLKGMLRRRVHDERLRWLVDAFIDAGAPGSATGRGLPIGNLTSQHFANFYLGALDRFVVRGLGAPGYCRYMDDILVFGDAKRGLWRAHAAIDERVRDRLDLTLKHSVTRLAPVSEGVPFLGFVLFPALIRFDSARARRWRMRMRELDRALDAGTLAPEDAQRVADSLMGWAQHGDTFAFRRSWATRRPRQRGTEALIG